MILATAATTEIILAAILGAVVAFIVTLAINVNKNPQEHQEEPNPEHKPQDHYSRPEELSAANRAPGTTTPRTPVGSVEMATVKAPKHDYVVVIVKPVRTQRIHFLAIGYEKPEDVGAEWGVAPPILNPNHPAYQSVLDLIDNAERQQAGVKDGNA